jgi:hypothetical protein
VGRCFGVLQARFAIIRNPCRQWSMDTISNIMFVCCMILEDESDVVGLENILGGLEDGGVQFQRRWSFGNLMRNTRELYNEDIHYDLREDLTEHL